MNATLVLAGDRGVRVAAVAARFDLAPAFVDAYLASRPHIGAVLDEASGETDLFEKLGPLNEMYVRFALTTTERGRGFADFVAPFVSTPRRFLDVGCAYGGFLRAWRERGVDVVGVEIVPELAALARANLGGGAGDVIEADVLACEPSSLGAFDVIACNDVIEHVANGRVLVDKVSALLAPGGIAYFEIPNPDAISFVARDGHFQQFGLTLLPRPLAARYYQEATGRPYEGMGELVDEATCARWFDSAGLAVIDAPQPHAQRFDDVHDRVFELVNAFTWWHGHQRAAISPEVSGAIVDRYWAYSATMFTALERAHRKIDRPAFERRYLAPFWTFVVRRSDSAVD